MKARRIPLVFAILVGGIALVGWMVSRPHSLGQRAAAEHVRPVVTARVGEHAEPQPQPLAPSKDDLRLTAVKRREVGADEAEFTAGQAAAVGSTTDLALGTSQLAARHPAEPENLNSGSVTASSDNSAATATSVVLPSAQIEELFPQYASGIIEITVPGGTPFRAQVGSVIRDDSGNITAIAGRLAGPQQGQYFISEEPAPSVLSPLFGVIRSDDSQNVWKIGPNEQGQPVLAKAEIDDVICHEYRYKEAAAKSAANDTESSALAAALVAQSELPIDQLESLPGALGVIYLDFDGETGTGETYSFYGWDYEEPRHPNSVTAYMAGATTPAEISSREAAIREIFARVSEDFAPFRVNVTTSLAVFQNAPANSKTQCIFTPDNKWGGFDGLSGVAIDSSFNSQFTQICWCFDTNAKYAAETASHEAGHTLRLDHDGVPGNEYYGGYGSGETSWAPIMGDGNPATLSQWSKGEYTNATNLEDDLQILSGQNNNVSYRTDDHGGSLNTATVIQPGENGNFFLSGLIERNTDQDSFRVQVDSSKRLSVKASGVFPGSNLDTLLELFDSSGNLLGTSNPLNRIGAEINQIVQPGTYEIRIRSIGKPAVGLVQGYSNYACLGQYSISGTVSESSGLWVASDLPDPINWARIPGAVATQSSTSNDMGPSRAIDGVTSGAVGNITHTNESSSNSWWQVDLGVARSVSAIKLWNRTSNQNRLSNFRIIVSDSEDAVVSTADFYTTGGNVGASETWQLPEPVMARTVRIQLLGKNGAGNGVLSLAEVEVWSPTEGSLSSAASASQSTTSGNAVALKALDGVVSAQSSASTDATTVGNWWELRLGQSTRINQVLILPNTTDATAPLSNFRVSLFRGNALMHYQDFFVSEGQAPPSYSLRAMEFIDGDRIRIALLGPNRAGNHKLSLAEVKVFGQAIAQNAAPYRPVDNIIDEDNDQLSSTLENVLGTNPTVANGWAVSRASDGVRFLLRTPAAASGVAVEIETSTDLLEWTLRSPQQVLDVDQTGAPEGFQRVFLPNPAGGGKLFVRVKATVGAGT